MKIEVSVNCEQGVVRENNEDMILAGSRFIRNGVFRECVGLDEKQRMIWAVADGMGGYGGGEVASEMVLQDLVSFFTRLPENLPPEALVKHFCDWIQEIHRRVLLVGRDSGELKNMGTTLVAFVVYEAHLFWINCGDSRMYRFRNGILCRLTRDHSLPDAAHLLTNSVGAGKTVFLDIKEITDEVFENDVFLLCSDGLTDALKEEEIESVLPRFSAGELVYMALKAGAKDNISVCLLKF